MTRHRLALLIALVAIILPRMFMEVAQADSPQLNALATLIAGSPITVECFAPSPRYEGYVLMTSSDGVDWHPLPVIHLDGRDCGALQNVLTPGPRTARWLRSLNNAQAVGQAVHALTHEAYHIALASADEGLVECTAYRNDYNSVKLLHMPWKVTRMAYTGAENTHLTLGDPEYRSVC